MIKDKWEHFNNCLNDIKADERNLAISRDAPSKSKRYSPLHIKFRDWDSNMIQGPHYLENNIIVEVGQVWRETSYMRLDCVPDTKKEIEKYLQYEVDRLAKRIATSILHHGEVYRDHYDFMKIRER